MGARDNSHTLSPPHRGPRIIYIPHLTQISLIRCPAVKMKTCSDCNRQFRDNYNLYRHIMSRHKTKAGEDVESSLSEDDSHPSEQTEDDADVEETESGTDSGTGEETQSADEEEETESEQDDTDSEESDENDPFDQLIHSARSHVQDEIEKRYPYK